MTPNLPNLGNLAWFTAVPVRRIFGVLADGGEDVRVIGGAVRNALMGRDVGDIDFATTATPERVTALATAAGIRTVPTGIDHGTVTLVIAGKGYEVTTLREDIATDGRHAVVRFGRDWQADAERRDFTVNALSVDASGTIHDPVGGYPDILAGRIRFIGDAATRIAEDRLRILRLFRFHAEYGKGDLDRDALSAAIRARNGIRELSAERIGQEIRRLVVAPRAVETVGLMQDAGILPVVLGGVGYIGALARLRAFEARLAIAPAAELHLAALGCRIAEDVERLTARLRLANSERDRMAAALAASRSFATLPDERGARAALYRLQPGAFRDGIAIAFAWSDALPDDRGWEDLYRLPERWPAPVFPLGGRDALSGGVAHGPAIGRLLRSLEAWWIDQDFAPDEAALRDRLQQMIAAEQ